MTFILPDILSLSQYISYPTHDKIHCIYCNRANPWRHGCYERQADRINPSGESMNPVRIQRLYCPGCHKTFSLLPECLPPRRWYLWKTQQAAILLFLAGNSARAVEKHVKPSRHTIKRWVAWLIVQFRVHQDALCTHFPSLGFFAEPVGFWKHVFDKLSLSTAMRLCHVSGVPIP